MAAPRRSHAGSVCCCIHCRWERLRCSWRGLESQTASPSLHERGSRHQRVEITLPQATLAQPHSPEAILSRAQRAHYRLSWEERLLCNARAPTTDRPTIKQIARPRTFCHLPRFVDGVRRLWLPQDALFSDRLPSPPGTSWPFFLTSFLFLSSAALFAPNPALPASSPGHSL